MKVAKRPRWVLVSGVVLTIVLSGMAFEMQPGRLTHQSAAAQPRKAPVPQSLPIYVPPKLSAPTGRMGGGTRGFDTHMIKVAVLAPDHVGLTVKAQPSLYWYLSQATALPIELTISKDRAIEPLFETRLRSPLPPGIQRVALGDYHVRLAPGVNYRWHVSVIYDLNQRSRDVVASGVIKLQEAPQALLTRLSEADKSRKPFIYAEAGFWYDAIASISELIEASPHNLNLRHQRAALTEQVSLQEVADYDQKIKGQ